MTDAETPDEPAEANSTDVFFWDAYLHWASIMDEFVDGPFPNLAQVQEALTKPPVSAASLAMTIAPGTDGAAGLASTTTPPDITRYEPIFIRLKTALTAAGAAKVIALLEREELTQPDLRNVLVDPELDLPSLSDYVFDLDEMLIGLGHAAYCGKPIEFFIYRPLAETIGMHAKDEALYDVIDVGPTAFVNPKNFTNATLRAADKQPLTIGAVIDNDIGFLNHTFRHTDDTTRFEAIWLQSRGTFPGQGAPDRVNPAIGRQLNQQDINNYITGFGADEFGAYREINTKLHGWEPFRRAPSSDTHGTSVAALAFGNDFYDDAAKRVDFPLLAVQLPPEAAADTSGTYSESYIVQGVRWLCNQAWALSVAPNLVINISYGALAGQKDGGKFIERQIAEEVTCWQKRGLVVNVVYAYGNGRNTNQVARFKVPADQKYFAPEWIIPRDAPLPSYLEIRAVDNTGAPTLVTPPATLRYKLTDPSGGFIEFDRAQGHTASPQISTLNAAVPARFYDVPDRRTAPGRGRPGQLVSKGMVQVAVAPAAAYDDDVEVALPGDWVLSFDNRDTLNDVELVLQIQRGDTAPGFVIGGRQSQFAGTFSEDLSGDFPTFHVDPPLTNEGTNSAYANAIHPCIVAVGAQQCVLGTIRDAPYSAQGADWTPKRYPDQKKTVDQIFTSGRLVSGTYSGTLTRVSGTSAAAALVSREKVLNLLK